MLVRVAGRDQKPRAGAQVRVFLANGKGPEGKTDDKGEVTLPVSEPRLLATATVGKDTALVDTDFYSSLAVAPDVFIYSDRPIYKPGDEVKFRGLLRQPDTYLARLFTPRKKQVTVKLESAEGREVTTRVAVDEFGSFHGTMEVPEDLGTGVLRVSAEVDDQAHQGEARVQDYVKPTFYLELTPEKENIVPGRAAEGHGDGPGATRAACPRARKYEVFLYRSLLDAPAWVDDAGKGGAGQRGDVRHRLHHRGQAQRAAAALLLRGRARRERGPWQSASKFDENGEAIIEINVPALAPGEERLPYRYTLTVRARDDQETFANASAAFFLSDVEVFGAGSFSDAVVKKGVEATLAVRATTLSGKPYGVTPGRGGVRAAQGGRRREEPGQARSHHGRGRHRPREGAHGRGGHGAGAADGEGQERQGVDGRAVHARHRRQRRAGGARGQPHAGLAVRHAVAGRLGAAGGPLPRWLGPGGQGSRPGVGHLHRRGPLRHAGAGAGGPHAGAQLPGGEALRQRGVRVRGVPHERRAAGRSARCPSASSRPSAPSR